MALLILAGCARERPSSKPPIHLNPNMDTQPKYKAQAESKFFDNGAAMQTPIEGTVAMGRFRDGDAFYSGKDEKGNFVKNVPMTVSMSSLMEGQERYDIFCSPCHSRVGDGKGIMIKRGYVPPPTFHDDRIRNMPDGQLYDVITNGVRNMPSYRHQIPPDDRWKIVLYLRALQRSRNATIKDVPVELRDKIK